MTDKELKKIADLIIERVTFAESEEFKHLEQREDRKAWVIRQILKLEVWGYGNQFIKQRNRASIS